ncbi:MAG TPA: sigma factor-like helix-turn-helix DNA-binding protein, partial [Thermomicrobiaceae bacterium]|nr:sigma factor-like helix-turn-helix DNA-binding protein [Thermomicrobiaceae bacterium]
YRIATNHALAHFRRKKLIRWVPLGKLLGTGNDPRSDDHGEWVATSTAIEAALARLEPRERACLLLKAAGFSSQEIGQQLGCSEGAARTRLSRARESFRRIYHQRDPERLEDS